MDKYRDVSHSEFLDLEEKFEAEQAMCALVKGEHKQLIEMLVRTCRQLDDLGYTQYDSKIRAWWVEHKADEHRGYV